MSYCYFFFLFFAILDTLTHTWGNMASHCSEYIEGVFLSDFHRSFPLALTKRHPSFQPEDVRYGTGER